MLKYYANGVILGFFILAALVFVTYDVAAWDSPDNGSELTMDDLVTLSSGAVTGGPDIYLVYEDITILGNDTLTISPGLFIEMKGGTTLEVRGSVQILGMSDKKVSFVADSSVQPLVLWNGLLIQGPLSHPSQIKNLSISHADVGIRTKSVDGLFLDNVSVDNCTIGLLMDEGSDNIMVQSFVGRDLVDHGLRLYFSKHVQISQILLERVDRALTATYKSDTPGQSLTISGFSMSVTDGISISQGDRFEIRDGVLAASNQTGIQLQSVDDILLDNITVNKPIVINKATGSLTNVKASWMLRILDSNLDLTNITSLDPTRILIDGGSARMRNLTIIDSHSYGLFVYDGAAAEVENSTISGSTELDIWVAKGAKIKLIDSHFETYRFYDADPSNRIVSFKGVKVRVLDAWSGPIHEGNLSINDDSGNVNVTVRTRYDGWTASVLIRSFEATPLSTFELVGNLSIIADNGWLMNGTTAPVNMSHRITLVLRDTAPPELVITVPDEVNEDSSLSLDASGSRDNDPDLLITGNVTWTMTSPYGNLTAYGFTSSMVLSTPGTYTINVTLVDRHGNVAIGNTSVKVLDVTSPIPIGSNQTIALDDMARFDASASSDNDPSFPTGASYIWVIQLDGGMETLSGRISSYRFQEPGNFTVTLTVTDGAGNSGSRTYWVLVIDNSPPFARAGDDMQAFPGRRVILDAGTSTDDHLITLYKWTVPGDPIVVKEGVQIEHVFEILGEHVVNLTVVDASGNEGYDEMVVHVTANRPVLSITSPDNGSEVENVIAVLGNVVTDFEVVALSYRVIDLEGPVSGWVDQYVSGDFSLSINVEDLPSGEYWIELKVDDGYTDPGEATLSFIVKETKDGNGGDDPSQLGPIVLLAIIIVVTLIGVWFFKRRGDQSR